MKKLLLFFLVLFFIDIMFVVVKSAQAQDVPKDSIFSAKLYPTPNYGLFHVKINSQNKGDFSCAIHDMLGRLIYQKMDLKANGKETIDLNYIPILSGLYYVKIFNKDEGVIVLKTQIMNGSK